MEAVGSEALEPITVHSFLPVQMAVYPVFRATRTFLYLPQCFIKIDLGHEKWKNNL